MSAIDLIANAASGGLLGVAGSAISKVANYLDNEQNMKAKVAEYKHELDLYEAQAKLKIQEETLTAETANNTALTALQTASYSMSLTSPNVSPIINNILSMIRPCITVGFIIITFFIWCRTDDVSIINRITDTVLFLTTSSTSWWFGSRLDYLAKSKR